MELEKFLNDKESDGFVYVSFGSVVLLSALPDNLKAEFFGALSEFPRLRFLIKVKGELPENVPKNIFFQNWFPQKDVLAHPKIKAFISQNGRPSSQEAICYGVPMISIPIFADQDFNAYRLEQIGASVLLDIGSLTKENFAAAIREIVGTDKYKTRLSELSRMYRDRPVDPVENALYWVNYVMKYDTSLLKPLGRHHTWWQRRLLDVYAVLLLILIFIAIACIVAITLVLKFLHKLVNSAEIRCEGKQKSE